MGCALFLLGRRVRAHFTGPLGVDQLPLKPNRWRALRRQFLNCSEQNVNPFAVLLDCPFKLAQLLALFGLGCKELPQADECAHDRDVHLDSTVTVQDAGEHCHALLRERHGRVP